MSKPFYEFFDETRDLGFEQSVRRFYSIYRGTVVSVEDPEQRGRIRVSCPLITEESELADWAMPLSPFAGAGFGIFFPPYEGDQVRLMFEHGDPHHPFYMGGWWAFPNKSELPKEVVDKKTPKTSRMIKTKIGHAIIFEDGDGSSDKGVKIQTGQDLETPLHVIRMSDLAQLIEIVSAQGHKLTMHDANKFVSIVTKGGHQLDMDDNDVKILIQTLDAAGHKIELDEQGQVVTIRSRLGNQIALSDAGKKITINTTLQRQVVMDDTGQSILVSDPTGNQVLMTPSGVTVLAAAAVNVTAGSTMAMAAGGAMTIAASGLAQSSLGPSSMLSTGLVSSTILGGQIATIVGAIAMMILGSVGIQITGAVAFTVIGLLQILSKQLVLGQAGAATALCKSELFIWLKSHTHTVPALGVAPPAGPTLPGVTLPPDTAAELDNPIYATQHVRAS